jgi:hypothetical protein
LSKRRRSPELAGSHLTLHASPPFQAHEHVRHPPAPVAGRVLSVRAYDEAAMMTDATVLPGERFAEHAAKALDDEDVAFLHVHFAGPGCFAFRVDRA